MRFEVWFWYVTIHAFGKGFYASDDVIVVGPDFGGLSGNLECHECSPNFRTVTWLCVRSEGLGDAPWVFVAIEDPNPSSPERLFALVGATPVRENN